MKKGERGGKVQFCPLEEIRFTPLNVKSMALNEQQLKQYTYTYTVVKPKTGYMLGC